MAAFNKQVLEAALRARSVSEERLGARTGYSVAELHEQWSRQNGPSQSLLNSVAKELAVPPFIFFMAASPPLVSNLVDFRHPNPKVTEKSRATTESIQVAYSVQREAERFSYADRDQDLPTISLDRRNVIDAANSVRNYFDISILEQKESKDTRAFYYLCRRKIEAKQIFVIQDSFTSDDGSGYALWHDRYPIIVVNTHRQNIARRLFTLIHELAHVLLRQTGISDPFVRSNELETYCNQFAAEFLVPAGKISELLAGLTAPRRPTTDDVARLSRRLKFSQQATILRLEQSGLVEEGSYEAWLRSISNRGNPDFENKGGGSGAVDQHKVKLAKYGYQFAKTFERALADRKLTDIELFRISGIKPKWLSAFFEYAREGSPPELEDE
jgi:Zn-dependent peptidase ImmA (M78 family)